MSATSIHHFANNFSPNTAANAFANTSSLIARMPHALWCADQMARYQGAVLSTGFASLNAELPNGGWPRGALIELLLQQCGIGELQLLRRALTTVALTQRIVLIQPPHLPQVAAWSSWGLPSERLLWIKTSRAGDALWSAEQVLRNGSCGALLLWQTHIRSEALRRLHLAAQSSETLFWMMRPMANRQDASPSPLRLALRPAAAGINIDIVKRRGPQSTQAFYVAMDGMPSVPALLPTLLPAVKTVPPSVVPAPLLFDSVNHALMDLRAFAATSS